MTKVWDWNDFADFVKEMDCGKEKRKRGDKEDQEVDARKKKLNLRGKDKDKVEEAAAKMAPTDEEVDEFYTILRRMQVAVKYFKKESKDGWRAAVDAVVDDEAVAEEEEEQMVIKRGGKEVAPVEQESPLLDLNAIPVSEDSDG